ncbi:MAG: tRNA 2-thiouridine(34) synthase MnmA [Verrucomicrobia bacterium]|nr:MAG: tRNA 2-thiouridine(34) synthase MnmA [Verrucomicrobiota bacterium]
MGEKIMVALSGGVDSAVAMLLLKQGGAEVSAAYMKTWMNEEGIDVFGDCPWHRDILDAEACAKRAGVPFEVVDFIREYREQVVDYMVGEYRAGRTPNPDAMCNRKMKFGKFLEYAKARGFSKVATGHYCQDRLNADGSKDLLMGADPGKDQSYFLAMITQSQLQDAVFPIGSLLKSQVRDLARMNALPNCDKKDSQGICFLGKIRIQDFLRRHIPEKRGDIVNAAGRKVGEHRGLFNYTIGQRKGIGVPSNADGKRYVVVAKDCDANVLRVDFESPEAENLYSTSAVIGGINWINKKLESPVRIEARVRYRDGLVGAKFTPLSEGCARVDFDVPQRALAAGQILALHLPPVVLGGGFVESVS